MKIRNIILFVFISLSVVGFSQQQVDFEKKNFPNDKEGFKKAVEEFETGEHLYHQGEFQLKNALRHLKKAYAFNPNHAKLNYMIGKCIIETIHRAEAVEYFERAYKLDPYVADDIALELGRSHHEHEDWNEAIKWYRVYEEHLKSGKTSKNKREIDEQILVYEKHIRECDAGRKYSANPERVFVDNVGGTINTEWHEYGPVITADNATMYFTSRRPGSLGSHEYTEKDALKDRKEQDYYEDIYVTHREGETWTTPVNLGHPINTEGQDATVALTPDGSHMIFYNATTYDGVLYEATLKGDKWSHPVKMDKHINTRYHESSAVYSLDKKIIYFVSNKPDDNIGMLDILAEDGSYTHDIFYTEWDEKKKKWGEAKNIGNTINTIYHENGVFLHPDGKTLYFSSQGHDSMGGYDIFKTVKQADGSWSQPENLGYPVNGPDDDVFFTITADGRTGYYATESTDGYGKQDIYEVTFLGPEKEVISLSEDNLLSNIIAPVSEKVVEPLIAVTENQTTILKGVVLDAITLKPVEASIVLMDNDKNEQVATFTSNSSTGKFLVSLPSGKNYGIAVEAEGYLFHSENFDIPATEGYNEVEKEVLLKKVVIGSSIVLKNIFFDFDKATLRDVSIPELTRLINFLNEVPSLRIEISGHTDSRGSDEYNQKLSEDRAKAVVAYLVEKGISAKRLEYKGYGETKPIATNETDEGRQQNRRTEFKILSK